MSTIITELNIGEYRTGLWPDVTTVSWDVNLLFEPEILSNFPNLQILDCSRSPYQSSIHDVGYSHLRLRTLSWLHYCPQLLELICWNNRFETLDGIEHCPKLERLDCVLCTLMTLAGIENCKQLQSLNCSLNRLLSLAELGACTTLRRLQCSCNRLVSLMGLKNCSLLEHLRCVGNQLESLRAIEGCSQLQELICRENRLSSLSQLRGCPQLLKLYCDQNQLVSLDGIEVCSQLQVLHCNHNRLTSLGNMVYLQHLRVIRHDNNPLAVQTVQTQRFVTRLNRGRTSSSIYSDNQNVHDITVQKSVCESVRCLLTDSKPRFSIAQIIESGMSERAVRLLLEYCDDEAIHSVHLLTFKELLGYVWARISRSKHRVELIKILGEQITDSECKCFTGRFNRTLSVLVGFYDDIVIEIADSSRIGAIIIAVRDRLELYDPEVHQELARIALLEAGYDEATIIPWLEAILDN